MLKYSDFFRLKRLYLHLKNKYVMPLTNKNRLYSLKNNQLYSNPIQGLDESETLSYLTNIFNLTNQEALAQWIIDSDQEYGGSSKGQILFDQQQKCIRVNAKIDVTQKDKMLFYPHISLSRRYPYFFRVGPFNTIQIQAKTDGKPLQIGIVIRSHISGPLKAYGTIVSKSKQWCTYQLPFINMIIHGTQQDQKSNSQYFASNRGDKIFDLASFSMERFMKTQLFSQEALPIQDVQIRLLSMKREQRFIDIRKINFVNRKGYQNFINDYKLSYFYIVNDDLTDESIKQKNPQLSKGVRLLEKGFNSKQIDTGDVKYIRRNQSKLIK